jgi:N-acetylneuraminic acid mutarotase
MEPMPTARACLDANVVDDKIYLIGGKNYVDVFPFQQSNNKNQVYDPSNDSWFTKTSIPTSTFLYASAVADNKIHIIGGYSGGNFLHLNQIYNPETDTWSYGKEIPTAILNTAAGATTGLLAPKRIYVLGGHIESSITSNLTQMYDPENDTWTTGTPMPTPRWSLRVAVVNDELYAIGGYNGETPFSVNEKYTPTGYIPEFSSWMVFPLFLTVTLVVVVSKRKLSKTPN